MGMKKRIPVLSAMIVFCFFALIFNVHGEERKMLGLNVDLDRSYGRCLVRWDEPEGYEGKLDYRVTLLAVSEDGTESPGLSERCEGTAF